MTTYEHFIVDHINSLIIDITTNICHYIIFLLQLRIKLFYLLPEIQTQSAQQFLSFQLYENNIIEYIINNTVIIIINHL